MSDLEQIIDGVEPEPVETQPEPQQEQPEAKEPEAEPKAEEKPEPVVAKSEQTEAEKALIGVVSDLRAQLRDLKAGMPRPEPAKAPDFYENPEAALQYHVEPIQQALLSTKLESSRFMAEREFGKEVVEAAFAYFNDHPDQSHALLNHPSPFHAAVEEYNKNRVATEIGNDPEAWIAKRESELREKIEAELVAKQAKEAAAQAAPSMANVPGTGGGPKTAWTGPTDLEGLIG